jgi:hypothetical protein
METNKSIAKAKRIQKICEEKVAESREKRIPFSKLEDVLVERTWLADQDSQIGISNPCEKISSIHIVIHGE